jgi:transposase
VSCLLGVGALGLDGGVGARFVSGDREQVFLLPPDMRDWLPESDLAWTVIDAVGQLDLSGFEAAYRADGRSRPPYDPAVMVALLLFAYCDGVRSSRQIERRCERDVAYRVVSGNLRPDHATIARFRVRHRQALAGVFTQVLRLCAQAGLLRVGLVALDGTKMAAPASPGQNRTREQLDAEIAEVAGQVEAMLAEAERVDADEDAAHGSARGDEPPAGLMSRQARLERLRAAKDRLDAEHAASQAAQEQRQMDWQARRAAGGKVGRPPGDRPPAGKRARERVNVTDPDSRSQVTSNGLVQGYNAQAVVAAGQIIVATDVQSSPADNIALHPMIAAAQAEVEAATGGAQRIRGVLADAGYGGRRNLTQPSEVTLLVSTSSGRTSTVTGPPRHPAVAAMHQRVRSRTGRRLMRRRGGRVEPVFGQIKNRLGNNLHHRGLEAARAEWRLIATSHNLAKYWRATALQPA